MSFVVVMVVALLLALAVCFGYLLGRHDDEVARRRPRDE